ncbi:hypothetical protein BURPS1710b_1816 [Burkholderia pseudomallei 1710b]|uniref:Uncharacterized protein n=1 Tax=Burkholderia pseudomallei (strain 1710b) TaxID=320372 RepID=Q3JT86_BURP1|nr:hypothetical protein BURPS1710b_1816 [Burkholderia pseudomallei 1710b]
MTVTRRTHSLLPVSSRQRFARGAAPRAPGRDLRRFVRRDVGGVRRGGGVAQRVAQRGERRREMPLAPDEHRIDRRHAVDRVHAEAVRLALDGEHRARRDRDARARRDARDDRVIRAEFEHALGLQPLRRVPALDAAAVRAAALERDERRQPHVARRAHARMAARREQHQFFGERGRRLERLAERLGAGRRRDERGVELEVAHETDQLARRAGDELERDVGPRLVVAGEQGGQAARRGAFHRAEPQPAVRPVFGDRVARLVGEREQTLRIRQQRLAGRGEHEPAAVAHEKRRAELLLQLLDARRDVRLHTVELCRRARHAVLAHDRAKDRESRQIHDSLRGMDRI